MNDETRERIRSIAYNALVDNPNHPNADKLRQVLSALPKMKTGRDIDKLLQLSGSVGGMEAGEMSAGDIGADLPPTRDESLNIDKGLKKPGLGTRAAVTAAGVRDPKIRRQFERGVDDMVLFGAGQKLAAVIDPKSFGPDQEYRDLYGIEPGQEGDAERQPVNHSVRQAGNLLGAFLPGATTYVAKNVMTPLQAIAGRATSTIGGRAAAGALAGAAGTAGAGSIISGAQSAVQGNDPRAAMAEAVTDPMNLVIGGAFGGASGLAQGIRRSPGQTGRDIRLVEEYGARPTPFGGAKGGIFDTPIMQGVESTSRDAGALASRASKTLNAGLEEERRAIQAEYNAGRAEAQGLGQLEGKVRPDYIVDEANKLLASEALTVGEKAEIQREVVEVLQKYPNGIPILRANELKQKVQRLSNGEGPMVSIGKAAKAAIDETEMGPINAKYHEGMEGLRRKRGQLNLQENTEPRVAEDRVARHIMNRGENVGGVGIQEPDVETFIAENPKYKSLFDAVSSLNARGRMGFSLTPEGGSLIHRLPNLIGHNIEPVAVGAYRLGAPLEDKGIAAALAARYLLGMQGADQ